MHMDTSNPVAHFLSEGLPEIDRTFRHNPVQIAYAGSVSQALGGGPGKIHFIEGDTGIGKSLAYLLTLADWTARGRKAGRQGVVSTHSRALQRQLRDERNLAIINRYLEWQGLPSLTMSVRMGKTNYACRDRLALALGCDALPEVATDNRRLPEYRRLAQWALETDGCLLELEDDALPDGIRIRDIALHESDAIPDYLRTHFEDIQGADIQVINHALLAMDLLTQNGITLTDDPAALVLDEAEHFPAVAQQLLSRQLSFRMTRGLLAQLGLDKASRTWADLQRMYQSADRANQAEIITHAMTGALGLGLEAILKARPRKERLASDPRLKHDWKRLRGDASAMLEAFKESSSQVVLSYSPVLGLPSLAMHDTAGGGLLKSGIKNRTTILTSATLSNLGHAPGEPPSFSYIRQELVMGREDTRLGVEHSHQALNFGDIAFSLPPAPRAPLTLVGNGQFELHPAYVDYAWKEIAAGASGRTLVLCVSYSDVSALLERCPEDLKDRVVAPGRGSALNELAEQMPEDGIFITPAGWEGLSPARQGTEAFWAHVVLLRNPTPRPDPVIELTLSRHITKQTPGISQAEAARMARATLMNKGVVQTVHKIRQGLGRTIRHPDDSVNVTLLDPRFPRPKGNTPPGVVVSSRLLGAIPFRFLSAYEEGDSVAETAIREEALIL